MRNNLKRALSLLVALSMCLSMMSVAAFADEEIAQEPQESATETTENASDTTENASDTTENASDTTESATETTESATETTESATDTAETAVESAETAEAAVSESAEAAESILSGEAVSDEQRTEAANAYDAASDEAKQEAVEAVVEAVVETETEKEELDALSALVDKVANAAADAAQTAKDTVARVIEAGQTLVGQLTEGTFQSVDKADEGVAAAKETAEAAAEAAQAADAAAENAMQAADAAESAIAAKGETPTEGEQRTIDTAREKAGEASEAAAVAAAAAERVTDAVISATADADEAAAIVAEAAQAATNAATAAKAAATAASDAASAISLIRGADAEDESPAVAEARATVHEKVQVAVALGHEAEAAAAAAERAARRAEDVTLNAAEKKAAVEKAAQLAVVATEKANRAAEAANDAADAAWELAAAKGWPFYARIITKKGVIVTVSAQAGVFPKGTEVTAEDVEPEDVEKQMDVAAAQVVTAVDISFWLNGRKIQPDTDVGKVNVTFFDPFAKAVPTAVKTVKDGVTETIEIEVRDGEVSFEAEHFTTYTAVKNANDKIELYDEANNLKGTYDSLDAAKDAAEVGDVIKILNSEKQVKYTCVVFGENNEETFSGKTLLYEVVKGFYQDGDTYDKTSNFYITDKDGLKYFRDWVNGTSPAMNAYQGFLTLTLSNFASNNGMDKKNVHLLSDVDLTGEVWQPIGPNSGAVKDKFASNWKAHFYGSFYGHGHVISNMDTSKSDQEDKYSRWPQGFFGSIANCGTIDGLILENVKAISNFNDGYAGAIVGDLGSNPITITNCVVRGDITIRGGDSGAIYGIGNGSVTNCTVSGSNGSTITGSYFAGGLVGAKRNGAHVHTITGNSVSGVTVSSSQFAGKLVGSMAAGAEGTLSVLNNTVDNVTLAGTDMKADYIYETEDDRYTTIIILPVAKIGSTEYASLAAAIAEADAGDVVEVVKAGTYTLPNLPKNITIKGAVDGVVFNHTGGGNVASVADDAAFENITFVFGKENYHGFQQPRGTISFKKCTLNGLFFTYDDMSFNECTFNAPGSTNYLPSESAGYSMWVYSSNDGETTVRYTDCIFNGAGKFINVYSESSVHHGTVIATGCTFNSTTKNKAAFNVKATSGSNPLTYDVTISNCTYVEDGFTKGWTENGDGTKLYVISSLVQVDDVKADVASKITVTLDDVPEYPLVSVKFNANGGEGSMADQTFGKGATKALNANSFTRTGYIFTGWTTAADGSGDKYADKAEVTLTGNLELYAQWGTPVAQIGTGGDAKYFTTLAAAIAAAEPSDTITLLANIALNDTLTISKPLTIDGRGLYKLHPNTPSYFENKASEQTAASSAKNLITVNANGVTLKNLTIESRAFSRYEYGVNNGCVGTLDNVTLDHRDHSSRGNDSIQLNGGLIIKNNITIKLGASLRYYDDGGNKPSDGIVAQSWGGISFNSDNCSIYFVEGSTFTGENVYNSALGKYGQSQAMIHLYHSGTFADAFAQVTGAIPSNLVKVIGTGWSMTGYEVAGSKFLTDNYLYNVRDNGTVVYYQSRDMAIAALKSGSTINIDPDSQVPAGCTAIKSNADGSYNESGAYWTVVPVYTVTWKNADGTTLKTDSVASGATPVYSGEALTRTGYTFSGWTPEIVAVTKDATYTATWTPVEYSISYDLDSGAVATENPTTYTVESGAITLNNPTRTGYTFAGWTGTGLTGATVNVTIPAGSTGDRSYTATWTENNRTITFWSNDGNGNSVPQTVLDSTPTALTANSFTRTGYTFRGWNTADDGSGTDYEDKTEVTLTDNLTLYAQWEINTLYVQFDANGGSGDMTAQPVYYGTATKLTANEFTREGYTFTGWSTTIDGTSGANYADKAEITLTAGGTYLYAQWSVNRYTITFDANGGTAVASITQDYGTAVTAPADPTREGYTFTGWDKTIPTTMPAENLTITAQWSVNGYTITFDANGGSAVAPITQNYGTAVTAPAAPTREGYTFTGWDKTVPTTMPAENLTITAQWSVNRYTITFDANGGTAVASITQNFGTAINAPANPTRAGYTFAGWSPAIPATMPAENLTLTATWTVNSYTITFNANGGSAVNAITQDYGTAVTAPADPTRTGYTFTGWDKAIPATMPAEDVTITATWTINRYTVRFLHEDGTVLSEQTLDYGTTPVYGGDHPVKEQTEQYVYTFAGWSPEIGAVTGDADYTAVFTQDLRKYAVTFRSEGETLQSVQVAYGTVPQYSGDTPTKESTKQFDYSFSGWDPALTEVTGEAVYNATFEAKLRSYDVSFVDDDGEVISEQTVLYGKLPVIPADPEKTDPTGAVTYTFAGWDPAVTVVTDTVIYTATYTNKANLFTIRFLNADGTELQNTRVPYGELPVYKDDVETNPPKRDSLTVVSKNEAGEDVETVYTFVFDGWDKPVTTVRGNADYTATYTVKTSNRTMETSTTVDVTETDEGTTTVTETKITDVGIEVKETVTTTETDSGATSTTELSSRMETASEVPNANNTVETKSTTTTETDSVGAVTSSESTRTTTSESYAKAEENVVYTAKTETVKTTTSSSGVTTTETPESKTTTVTLESVESEEPKVDTAKVSETHEAAQAAATASATISTEKVDVASLVKEALSEADTSGAKTEVTVSLELRTTLTGATDAETQEGETASLTYDVTPYAVVTQNDKELSNKPIENTQLAKDVESKPITFNLPVPNSFLRLLDKMVRVTHKGEKNELLFLPVSGTQGALYVTLNVTHFSEFEIEASSKVKVTYDGPGITAETHEVEYGEATPDYAGTVFRAGYTFAGWGERAETATADVTYTARWRAIPAPVVDDRGSDSDSDDSDSGSSSASAAETVDIAEEETPLGDRPWWYIDVSALDWAYNAIVYVTDMGIMNGTGEDTFSPKDTTTVDMITAMLYRAVTGESTKGKDWAEDAKAWAAELGLTEGIDSREDAGLTREQMAVMMYRLAKSKGLDTSLTYDLSYITDVGELSEFARAAMEWAMAVGIIKGTSETTISPARQITREEIATIMMRYNELLKGRVI